MIDLRNAKPGDKLISRCGEVFTYIGFVKEGGWHPHMVKSESKTGTRCNDGRFAFVNFEPDEDDIVEIIPQ